MTALLTELQTIFKSFFRSPVSAYSTVVKLRIRVLNTVPSEVTQHSRFRLPVVSGTNKVIVQNHDAENTLYFSPSECGMLGSNNTVASYWLEP